MPPSVRFTSVDQRTYRVQSDDCSSTASLLRANSRSLNTMLPKQLSSVHLIFVDGRKEGDEIEFSTTSNIALGYQLDEYRRKAGRLNDTLSFEYGNANVMGTETPEELDMKDEDWIYVFPRVTPGIQENQDDDDELEAQVQLTHGKVDDEVSEDNENSEDDEDSEEETAEDAHVELTGPVTSDELGTIITSESRIISLIEAELDFVNRNLHLVITKAPDGRTNMFISTQSKGIPIPPAPRKSRHTSTTRDADDVDDATSGDTEIQDDPFDAYQELTATGSDSPEFVPGSRPGHNRNTTTNIVNPPTRPTGLGRPTKTGADRAPYDSKKAARTKKQEIALAGASTASRTLQAGVCDNAAEKASYPFPGFDPKLPGLNPGNIDPQLASFALYSGLPQAGSAFQPECDGFLDEEDRAILEANAHFGDFIGLSIPRMTQADLDAQFPSDVIVPRMPQQNQNFIHQDQDIEGETHTPEHDCPSDEENADMDTDTSMLDQEGEERAILDADTAYINAVKYINPDFAASLMGGPKPSPRSARVPKSKTSRTPQKAPRTAAKPRKAAAGSGVSNSKATKSTGGRAKAKNADTGAGVVKSVARKAAKSKGKAAAKKKGAFISDEIVFDDGDEEEEP